MFLIAAYGRYNHPYVWVSRQCNTCSQAVRSSGAGWAMATPFISLNVECRMLEWICKNVHRLYKSLIGPFAAVLIATL